jgi:hypothetical protein
MILLLYLQPEIDEEDEKALAAFMSKDDTSSKQSLGDIILQKIRDKDATVSTGGHQILITFLILT